MNQANKGRIYSINTIFEPLTIQGAYILGLTMSDACIDGNRSIRYNFASKDVELLNIIQKELCPNIPIKHRSYKHKNGKTYESDLLLIGSIELVNLFESYGIVKNKSGIEKIPKIKQELLYHYIRGLFDGDGCWSIENYNGKFLTHLSLTGQSLELMNQLKELFNGSIRKASNNCYRWVINKHQNIIDIGELIYKDSNNLRLERKYTKFLEIKDKINLRPRLKQKLLGD